MNKSRFEVLVTSYGRNKNRGGELKKKQEKANSSPRYHCAAIKNDKGIKYTYPADCRIMAAADSNKNDWDWKNRSYWKKKIFVQKSFYVQFFYGNS